MMRGRRVGHIPGGTCRVVEGDAVLRGGRPVALLEYGVQCLPRTLQNARSGPSRCTGTLRVYLIKILPEAAILGRTDVIGRIIVLGSGMFIENVVCAKPHGIRFNQKTSSWPAEIALLDPTKLSWI